MDWTSAIFNMPFTRRTFKNIFSISMQLRKPHFCLSLPEPFCFQKNVMGLDNDNVIGRKPPILRVAGDTRANVAPGLLAFHTLFVLEHNRLCDVYKSKHPAVSFH